ncbi:hypothetical protein K353_00236 [Kitasatospora sp. SolWspMP-SS2h]|uniref:hypothetical protein n=1 Tax=Kitasatospora TaxID=2063 RepID=UPI000DBFA24B|nr:MULTISPECIES: hypothetical protein [Kitasatospora]RAJ47035.1 hypothetical protein K353_00236 [Kitasatospora sp. SolWspMP-SS2h]
MISHASSHLRRWIALLLLPAAAVIGVAAVGAGAGHPGTGHGTRVVADLEWDVTPTGGH